MADFSTNFEDGELCLPSDIQRKISGAISRPRAKSKRSFLDRKTRKTMHHAASGLIKQNNYSAAMPNFEISNGAFPNGNNHAIIFGPPNVVAWVPIFYVIWVPMFYFPFGFQNHLFQPFPGLLMPQEVPVMIFPGQQFGGTGVFLPHKETGGTSLLLAPPPRPTHKENEIENNPQVAQKPVSEAAENKQENPQLPPEIYLPEAWQY